MADTPGHEALRHIDQVLARRPEKDDHALSAATICLTRLRDGMIQALRDGAGAGDGAPGSRERLAHVNGVISAVMGIHYPLGPVPWPELDKAREWLACIVQQEEG